MQWFMVAVLLCTTLGLANGGPIKPCKFQVYCPISPCQDAKPPDCVKSFTGVHCVDDNCGGCFAVWMDDSGKKITCDTPHDKCVKPDCAGPSDQSACKTDPCEGSPRPRCPEGADAQCIPNYCEGCNAVWVSPKGKTLGPQCQCIDCAGKFDFGGICKYCTCKDIISRGEDFLNSACNDKKFRETCCMTCRGIKKLKELPAIC